MPKRQNRKTKEIGEIWCVQLLDSTGNEIIGIRPALIFAINKYPKLYTVIPLTKNLTAKKFPNTYEITSSSTNRLNHNSVALIFQIRSLNSERFLNKIGNLEEDAFKRIKLLVKSYLKLG